MSKKGRRMKKTASQNADKVEKDGRDRLQPGAYRPVKAENISQKDLTDGCVLYDAKKGAVYTLNRTASFILTYCNGGSTVEEIARQSALAFGLTQDEAMRDVSSRISVLKDQELVMPG